MSARGERRWATGILLGLGLLAFLPLARPRDDVLNFVFLILLSITLAQSWNIVAGYAGQVNLGHAAFFGLGALLARTLWIKGTPIVLAMLAPSAHWRWPRSFAPRSTTCCRRSPRCPRPRSPATG
jgi:ABC-type branched-subunit amino acid transport system permease subunit